MIVKQNRPIQPKAENRNSFFQLFLLFSEKLKEKIPAFLLRNFKKIKQQKFDHSKEKGINPI